MVKHFIYGAAAIGAFLCGAIYPAYAAKLPRNGVFVFSSLCNEHESGDAAGYRIKLTRSAKGDSLYFEWSEGLLYGPALASNFVIDPKTSKITFTIPAHAPPNDLGEAESYSGQISTTAVILDGKEKYRVVPRAKNSNGKIGPCR